MSPRPFDRFMLHVHIGSHPKFARLTDGEFRATVAGVLPLAAMSPIRGRLLIADQRVEPQDVAHQARVSPRVAAAALEKLRRVGVVVPDDEHGCEQVHDFEDWNPAPKVDATNAERQARYRAKLKAAADAARNGVTHAPVTPDVTPTEVEGEVEEEVTTPPPSPRPGGAGEPFPDVVIGNRQREHHKRTQAVRDWMVRHLPGSAVGTEHLVEELATELRSVAIAPLPEQIAALAERRGIRLEVRPHERTAA